MYNVVFYNVDSRGFIDMDDVRRKAWQYHPKLILAGASAYPRIIDFATFREIANEIGAYFIVDMAHIAGLVAAGDHPSPFEAGADIITTTSQKTMRGPRGGIIFCKREFERKVNSAVFPYSQGGPLEHIIAAKGICAEEALTSEFKEYIHNVVRNSRIMAEEFAQMGYSVITGGTDTHLFLLDLTNLGLTGLRAQELCDEHGITLNKNCVPNETLSPKYASGVRIGTAAMTTKRFTAKDFIETAHKIDSIWKEAIRHGD